MSVPPITKYQQTTLPRLLRISGGSHNQCNLRKLVPTDTAKKRKGEDSYNETSTSATEQSPQPTAGGAGHTPQRPDAQGREAASTRDGNDSEALGFLQKPPAGRISANPRRQEPPSSPRWAPTNVADGRGGQQQCTPVAAAPRQCSDERCDSTSGRTSTAESTENISHSRPLKRMKSSTQDRIEVPDASGNQQSLRLSENRS